MAATGAPLKVEILPGLERIYSIDAFRGFTMVCMIAEGFGLLFFLNHPLLGGIARQFQHAQWHGMTAWDLVQPFFMFIVGAVMPISFARRWAAGESWGQSLGHVLRRCALLIAFGLLARSIQANRPVIDLINVLAQVAFTYLVAFLVLRKSWRFQGAAALGLLGLHWAIFQFAGAPGVQGPWVRDANIGWYLDNLILGKNWGGSYVTINCLSSAANTIAGAMAGAMLVSALPAARKVRILALTGVGCIAVGLAMDPVIPIIKKIWTASFAIYSLGFTLLALLFFYVVCDLVKKRAWARVFVVVGSNSIFIYLFHEILRRWMTQTGLVFTGWLVEMWEPGGRMLNAWLVIGFQIYLCFWLYRRKIFFKL
jgi:heparan-alpha-glucosaminide N-acetyltransferase